MLHLLLSIKATKVDTFSPVNDIESPSSKDGHLSLDQPRKGTIVHADESNQNFDVDINLPDDVHQLEGELNENQSHESSAEASDRVEHTVPPAPPAGRGYDWELTTEPRGTSLMPVGNASCIDDSGRRIQPKRKAKPLNRDSEGDIETLNQGQGLVSKVDEAIPTTYKQARESLDWPDWKSAIEDELNKMHRYQVWEAVSRTPDLRTLRARWVFTRKIDGTTGLPSTYKARWVAKGFSQLEGIDYTDVFSSVAHKDTVPVFLALVNTLDLECDQVDIIAAFLNGILKERIYMEPPEGSDIPSGFVLKLNKSLYGLKQSPKCFNESLDKWLQSEEFVPSSADSCLYTYTNGQVFIMLTVHVDDQLIASNNREALNAFKTRLNARFECKDQGPVNYFLGFNVIRDREKKTLSISQEHYLEQMLRKFNMADCHPTKTTLPTAFRAVPATDEEFEEAKDLEYPQMVGSIMYAATIARPDLSYPANVLARSIGKWSLCHFKAAKHLLRYIRGTTDLCLTYDAKAGKRIIMGYADADWGGCLDTRRSTTGYVYRTFGGIVSWKSRRQPTVALSTAEAEIMATTDAAKQAVWLRRLLQDLRYPMQDPIVILNDNVGAVELSQHPGNHDRTKHIDMRHLWVREKVNSNLVTIKYVPTEHNLADVFTKQLPLVKAQHFNQVLGLRQVPLSHH